MKSQIKSLLLRIFPRSLINFISTLKYLAKGDYLASRRRLAENERNTQMLALYLLHTTSSHSQNMSSLPPLNQHEISIYSQNGEDGILLYLFSLLGVNKKTFVEFGIGDGSQCNTANLSINFGWSGLLLEVDPQKASAAQAYYQQKISQQQTAVQIISARVTVENINELLKNHNMEGEIDLLSIDIDGNDYWVWQAITTIQPRVIVIEYNPTFGKDKSITVIYDPSFDRFTKHPSGYYQGASLSALTKLGHNKGYILVGCDSSGTNAFFVRQDVARNNIEAVPVCDAFFPSYYRSLDSNQSKQFELIQKMPFQEI